MDIRDYCLVNIKDAQKKRKEILQHLKAVETLIMRMNASMIAVGRVCEREKEEDDDATDDEKHQNVSEHDGDEAGS